MFPERLTNLTLPHIIRNGLKKLKNAVLSHLSNDSDLYTTFTSTFVLLGSHLGFFQHFFFSFFISKQTPFLEDLKGPCFHRLAIVTV